jgi:acetyl esterase/lipase
MNRMLQPAALLWIFAATGLLHGQSSTTTIDGRPSSTTSTSVRELRDIPYVTKGHERQRLDLYVPPQTEGLKPVIVWIHGGAWEAGSKANCPAKGMPAKGYVVASVGYRLSQHAVFPAQIEDCKAAIRWLRAHAAEYQIDPDRIGLLGESAGGHLVALLGTTGSIRDFDVGENLKQSSRVQCVIDWYGPTDFLHYGDPSEARLDTTRSPVTRLLGGTVVEKPELAKRASPIYYVKEDAAPFLIMQGDKDPLVPLQQSESLHAALQKAKVESVLKVYPGAGHGGAQFGSPDSLKLMVDFMDQHLSANKAK